MQIPFLYKGTEKIKLKKYYYEQIDYKHKNIIRIMGYVFRRIEIEYNIK